MCIWCLQGVFICSLTGIQKGGAAEENGEIKWGDMILKVNDTCVIGMSQTQVQELLANASPNVRFVLLRQYGNSATGAGGGGGGANNGRGGAKQQVYTVLFVCLDLYMLTTSLQLHILYQQTANKIHCSNDAYRARDNVRQSDNFRLSIVQT